MSDSWQDRIVFSPSGAQAYKPGQLLIRTHSPSGQPVFDQARDVLRERFRGDLDKLAEIPVAGHELISLPGNPEVASGLLRAEGFGAQPNHVLFSSSPWLWANPFSGNPFSGNPFSGNPFSGNPFSGNPFLDAQSRLAVYRAPGFLQGRDFTVDGRGRNLARPAAPLRADGPRPNSQGSPHVAVLDVPLPAEGKGFVPYLVQECRAEPLPAQDGMGYRFGVPNRDEDTFLDRVAGHGLFVAGRIAQIAPGSSITVHGALTNLGDGDEHTIAGILESLVGPDGVATVDIVNLSFGGYAVDDMNALTRAITRLQTATTPASRKRSVPVENDGVVVVAAAGNDATDLAPYPAALPGVISVGALGPDGPAPFTNYGAWVRACASGVDVVSTFFDGFNGGRLPDPEGDPDDFHGAATWSGTSFAAPLVAGRIAQLVRDQGLLPGEAVRQLLDTPGLARFPGLGTIVT